MGTPPILEDEMLTWIQRLYQRFTKAAHVVQSKPALHLYEEDVLRHAPLMGDFSAGAVYAQMVSNGYEFAQKRPRQSVTDALARLESKGYVYVVRRHAGRLPNLYRVER
jgi:hypothetical protein